MNRFQFWFCDKVAFWSLEIADFIARPFYKVERYCNRRYWNEIHQRQRTGRKWK